MFSSDQPRDAYGRWVASGRDFLSRYTAKLKEDARIALNRYTTGGGPGIKAQGVAATIAKRKEWAAENPFNSVKAIMAASGGDQSRLANLGALISAKLGLNMSNPGPKSEERLAEKVASGKAPGAITDATRVGWTVKSPEEADKLVNELAQHLQVADEGWNHTPAGYFDRKVIVRHADGMLGEIQLWPPGMLDAKEKGGAGSGHKLYELMQSMARKNPNDLRLPAVMRDMNRLYSKVLDKLPRSWDQAKARPS